MRAAAFGLACAITVGVGMFVDAAKAQNASTDAAELFRQGRAALEAKDYATACPKLAQSLALERAVGTLISLADCEQSSGKLAGARQHWQEAADFADAVNDPLHRGPYAREQLAAIDPRVPRLIVRLAPGAPFDTTLHLDQVDLGTTGFGSPLPVDPGKHTLTVAAAGHTPRAVPVNVSEGENRQLVVEPGTTPGASAQSASSGENTLTSSPEAPGHTQRTVAYAALGTGAAGIVAGTILGLTADAKWSGAKTECGTSCPPSSPAVSDRSTAEAYATASTIAFAVSAAAAAAGVVLLVTAPRAARPTSALWIAPTLGGFAVGARGL